MACVSCYTNHNTACLHLYCTRDSHATFVLLRGDAINGFSSKDRATDPSRMLSAYWHAAATLNYMRMRGCIVSADEGTKKQVTSDKGQGESNDCIYTSHECLLLPMEAAMTDPRSAFNHVMCCRATIGVQCVTCATCRARTCCGSA